MNDLRPFDLIMTWRGLSWNPLSWISQLITLFTNGGPSHVRLYLGEGVFWEVTAPKPRFGSVDEIDQNTRTEIGRHKNLPSPVHPAIIDQALAEMKRLNKVSQYDLGELFFSNLFDELGIDSSDQSTPDSYVCSSGVEHIFEMMGYPFRVDEKLVSPQNIRDSDFYEVVQ